jgi:hypothetical protein
MIVMEPEQRWPAWKCLERALQLCPQGLSPIPTPTSAVRSLQQPQAWNARQGTVVQHGGDGYAKIWPELSHGSIPNSENERFIDNEYQVAMDNGWIDPYTVDRNIDAHPFDESGVHFSGFQRFFDVRLGNLYGAFFTGYCADDSSKSDGTATPTQQLPEFPAGTVKHPSSAIRSRVLLPTGVSIVKPYGENILHPSRNLPRPSAADIAAGLAVHPRRSRRLQMKEEMKEKRGGKVEKTRPGEKPVRVSKARRRSLLERPVSPSVYESRTRGVARRESTPADIHAREYPQETETA